MGRRKGWELPVGRCRSGTVHHVISLLTSKFGNLGDQILVASRRMEVYAIWTSSSTMMKTNLSCATAVWRFVLAVQVGKLFEPWQVSLRLLEEQCSRP